MSYGFRWVSMMLALGLVAFAAGQASAQPGGGRGGFGGGFGGFGGAADAGGGLMLLQNESVAKELELADDQKEKIRELVTNQTSNMRDGLRDLFQGFRDLSEAEREERMTEIREKLDERRKEVESELDKILLPAQRDRLKQINFQMQNRARGGSTGGLTNRRVVEELGITEEQLEKLRAKEEEVRTQLQDKIRKATEEARSSLLEVLTPEQQQKFKDLSGEPFEMQFTPGQGGFGGRGQRSEGDQGGRGRRGGSERESRPET